MMEGRGGIMAVFSKSEYDKGQEQSGRGIQRLETKSLQISGAVPVFHRRDRLCAAKYLGKITQRRESQQLCDL